MNTIRKYKIVLNELKNLKENHYLTAYDDYLIEKLNLSTKQIGRMLDELTQEYDNIIKEKIGKKLGYKIVENSDIFVEIFDKFDDNNLGWFFQLAQESDPEIFKKVKNFTNTNQKVFTFKNSPFEDTKTLETKSIFIRLKTAVENREYRKIKFYHDKKVYDNLKCIKMIFMDNNWYIATISDDEILRFGRISFIESVEYATKINSFQSQSIQKYLDFIDNRVQNSMTLYDKKIKIAKIKALPSIAKYFQKDMKKFLSSQKFISSNSDGSVDFSLTYTQAIEILPFIKKWLPNLVILNPQELKEELKQDLQNAMKNY
jgi:hypothetical protein